MKKKFYLILSILIAGLACGLGGRDASAVGMARGAVIRASGPQVRGLISSPLRSPTPRLLGASVLPLAVLAGPAALTAQVGPAAGIAAQAAALVAPAAAGSEKPTLFENLSQELPQLSEMPTQGLKSAADDDFAARLGGKAAAAVSQDDPSSPAEIIVTVPEGAGLTRDINRGQTREPWAQGQIAQIGISQNDLARYHASLFGGVSKINTLIFKAPRQDGQAFIAFLSAKGYEARFGKIIPKPEPIVVMARKVGLAEMASIIRADRLQKELKKVLGEPRAAAAKPSGLSAAWQWIKARARRAFLGVAPANPDLPWAILDGYSWIKHPFLKGHFTKEVDNSSDGGSHGTHTAGTVVGMDIFNFSGRAYNIFPGGDATEGDILLKLNAAQADGALATTNSWGDTTGDPKDPIAQLFVKQAADGMHHSISAGNSGPYPNTIGGPAIATYESDLAINGKVVGKVKRIKAIAATEADMKTARFSSRGPGSRTTQSQPDLYKDYSMKPDEAGVGVNLVAPVPNGPMVPELGGPGQAMSGTSMSNPGVFGGFMLLSRAVLVLLADYLPQLPEKELKIFAMDVARYAMTQTARRIEAPENQGDGFIDVWEAFQFSAKLLKSSAHGSVKTALRQGARRLMGFWTPGAA
ncbi:MAG TPA: hypothetical protein DEB40_05140 [Elusimicrobia bacterium]|nr:hypothetical protein [Elusimicrobiota bacterium]HBT61109.1 hypothetical protein [Elusimicrobiota bacterium]